MGRGENSHCVPVSFVPFVCTAMLTGSLMVLSIGVPYDGHCIAELELVKIIIMEEGEAGGWGGGRRSSRPLTVLVAMAFMGWNAKGAVKTPRCTT